MQDYRKHLGPLKEENGDLVKLIDLLDDDKLSELQYLPLVFNEALRFEPPIQVSVEGYFNQDTTIKGIDFRKD